MPPHCDSMDGPVVRAARDALESHDVDIVLPFVHEAGEREVAMRLADVRDAKVHAREGVAAARRYVSAMLGLQVWSHKLFAAVRAPAHEAASPMHGPRDG